jgi:hypothetical protein
MDQSNGLLKPNSRCTRIIPVPVRGHYWMLGGSCLRTRTSVIVVRMGPLTDKQLAFVREGEHRSGSCGCMERIMELYSGLTAYH